MEMEPNGSDLCLICGLCCNALLHNHAILREEEIPLATHWGVTYSREEDGFRFSLPCPLFRQGKCAVYRERRFQVCRGYRCRLLQRYLHAENQSLTAAARLLEQAKNLQGEIEAFLPADTRDEPFWKRVYAWYDENGLDNSEESRRRHQEFLSRLTALTYLLQKYFWWRKKLPSEQGREESCPGGDRMDPSDSEKKI